MTKNVSATAYAMTAVGTGGTYNSWQPTGIPVITTYAIGVPHPQDSWGINPLTLARPDDPAEWPSAENSLFYYIDNSDGAATDTANTFGYPDKPRLTMPDGTFPAGTTMILGGGTGYTIGGAGRFEMTFEGTEENPCFLVGEGAGNREFVKEIRVLAASYFIIDGLFNTTNDQNLNIQNASTFVCVRNCTFTGPGTDVGNSSVLGCNGIDNDNRTTHVVWFNNTVSNWGDKDSVSENDYHAFATGVYVSEVWCIGNTAFDNGGDSIQTGQAGHSLLQRGDHIYIAKNLFHDDRENAVDVKSVIDVIISENEMHDYDTSSSSSGEIIVIHDDNERVWILNNVMYTGRKGVSVTSGVNTYVLGNEIRDTTGTVDFGAPYSEPNTAISMATQGPFSIANNTIHNSIISYVADSSGAVDSGTEVVGNIFATLQNASGWSWMAEASGSPAAMSSDFNLYQSSRWRVSSTDYTSLSAFQAAQSLDASSAEGNPLFTSEAGDDFTLQAGSPAIDLVGTEAVAYATFETDYGIDIRFDIDGNAKPATDADAGAYQRV